MKKTIAILICAIMALSMCACGSDKTENSSSGADSVLETSSESKQPEEDTSSKVDTNGVELTDTYKAPMKDIVIDLPNYQHINNGYTDMYVVGRKINIGITTARKRQANSLEEAHDSAFADYKIGVQNYAKIDELVIESDEKKTINGIEVYRFEGRLKCNSFSGPYEIYTVGYSFIMDGIPCSVEGTVVEKEQSQEYIDETRKVVDAMITTLRSEE